MPTLKAAKNFDVLDSLKKNIGKKVILSLSEKIMPLSHEVVSIPISLL
jgi:hypothetical protein